MAVLILLALGAVLGAAATLAFENHRDRQGRPTVTPEEAWDNGFQHGLRTAHQVVTGFRKPWITLGEERGWDLARLQLATALADELEQTHPNVTHGTAIHAPLGGVS